MTGESGDRRFLRSLIIALLLSFAWVGGAAAAAIESYALPDALSANDDASSAAVPIGFPINFFGVTHTELFVNNNGNVTFGAPYSVFTPDARGLVGTQRAIIAPFFADVDKRGAGSGIVRFGTPPGRSDLFVVDWVRVGYYNQHDDKLNSFQLILQDLSAVPDAPALCPDPAPLAWAPSGLVPSLGASRCLRRRHRYYEPVRLPTSARMAAPATPCRHPPPGTNLADPVGPLMFRRLLFMRDPAFDPGGATPSRVTIAHVLPS